MNRRLTLSPFFLWVAVIAFTVFVKTPLTSCAAERPNIVVILADDQSYRDFGFTGNPLVHTPQIDQLAAASARYPNGYVPMSVCRPSLATILTGLYPHQHGIHFNHPPPGLRTMQKTMTADEYHQARATTDYLVQNVPTLPRILAQHGYACLQTGKHWEGSYQTAGFTHGMTRGLPAKRLGARHRHPPASQRRMGRARQRRRRTGHRSRNDATDRGVHRGLRRQATIFCLVRPFSTAHTVRRAATFPRLV